MRRAVFTSVCRRDQSEKGNGRAVQAAQKGRRVARTGLMGDVSWPERARVEMGRAKQSHRDLVRLEAGNVSSPSSPSVSHHPPSPPPPPLPLQVSVFLSSFFCTTVMSEIRRKLVIVGDGACGKVISINSSVYPSSLCSS